MDCVRTAVDKTLNQSSVFIEEICRAFQISKRSFNEEEGVEFI